MECCTLRLLGFCCCLLLSSSSGSSPTVQYTDLPVFKKLLLYGPTVVTSLLQKGLPPITKSRGTYQKSKPIKEDLLSSAADETSKSCLLAAFAEESDTCLNALPLSSLGLQMDDSTFQIAISLHLGLAFCKPHCCHHCGCEITAFASHGLSCVKSQGRYHRHSSLNDSIHRALGASHIPS